MAHQQAVKLPAGRPEFWMAESAGKDAIHLLAKW